MAARTYHIQVDQSKPLAQEAETGHNRWHEDIAPIFEVEEGDRVIFDTRDAFDLDCVGAHGSHRADAGQARLRDARARHYHLLNGR